ncbi:unnamed protein product [Musa banksii]
MISSDLTKKRKSMDLAAAILLLPLCLDIVGVASDPSDHRYKNGDPVPLYANGVGPFGNPRFSTTSHKLTTEHITEKKTTLGEVLNGDRLVEAPYKLDFRGDIDYK